MHSQSERMFDLTERKNNFWHSIGQNTQVEGDKPSETDQSEKESKPNVPKNGGSALPRTQPRATARTSHHMISNTRAGKGSGRKSRKEQ